MSGICRKLTVREPDSLSMQISCRTHVLTCLQETTNYLLLFPVSKRLQVPLNSPATSWLINHHSCGLIEQAMHSEKEKCNCQIGSEKKGEKTANEASAYFCRSITFNKFPSTQNKWLMSITTLTALRIFLMSAMGFLFRPLWNLSQPKNHTIIFWI